MKAIIPNIFKSIFAKFTVMFILIGLIPLAGMSYLIFEKLPEEVTAYMVASYEESLLYAAKNIELKVQAYDRLTQSLYQYDDVENVTLVEALRDEDLSNLSNDAQRFLEDFMRFTLYSDAHIRSVFLVGPDQKVFDYYSKSTSYYYDNIEIDNIPGFSAIYENGRRLSVLPTHHEIYFTLKEREVISFVRNGLDLRSLPESEVIVTTLLLEVDLAFLHEIIGRMDLADTGNIYIADGDGHSIYASDGILQNANDAFATIPNNLDGRSQGFLVNGEQYTFYQSVEGTDWTLVYKVDKSNLLLFIEGFSTATNFLILLITGALVFTAITFSNNLSRPLRSISRQMSKVSSGDLESKVSVKKSASQEVTQLAASFNRMTHQLQLHIDKAYGAQIKQREAELNGLKTQIRPHYLYNTLEIIRMSALEEKADNTREMIVSLSEQLKYVIGQYGDRVTLGNEIDMIEHYFRIIEQRYEGRFSLDVDVPDDYYQTPMLKLLLQPLVENAVVHGLKPKRGKGRIRVSCKIDEGILTLDVMDDGVGMSEDKLAEIQALLESNRMGKELNGHWENIGLKNVHDRIQMNYGNAYGLTITSKEKLGSKMSLRFPIEV